MLLLQASGWPVRGANGPQATLIPAFSQKKFFAGSQGINAFRVPLAGGTFKRSLPVSIHDFESLSGLDRTDRLQARLAAAKRAFTTRNVDLAQAARMVRSSSPSAKTMRRGLAFTCSNRLCSQWLVGSSRPERPRLYSAMSAIFFLATPESIAAFATAADTSTIRRGSNGTGTM